MKHTLLITACLLGFTGFSGIVPSQASAQSFETSPVDPALSTDAVTRNDHTFQILPAPEFDANIGTAPIVSLRPVARGDVFAGDVVARNTGATTVVKTRNVRKREPRLHGPFPTKRVTAPRASGRLVPTLSTNHGVFR